MLSAKLLAFLRVGKWEKPLKSKSLESLVEIEYGTHVAGMEFVLSALRNLFLIFIQRLLANSQVWASIRYYSS